MSTSPLHADGALPTRLRATVTSNGERHAVTVLAISTEGFFAEGADLAEVGHDLQIALVLEDGDGAWRPRQAAAEPLLLEADAELLYVDLHRENHLGSDVTGFGARFLSLEGPRQEALQQFVAREAARSRDWRTRAGALHQPPQA